MKKFNALDIFICVVVFAVVATATIYLGSGKNNTALASDNKTVYFTIEAFTVPVGFSENINKGDTIHDSVRGHYYGVVDDIYTKTTTQHVVNYEDMVVAQAETAGRETIYLTVKCNGTESDREIRAEGQVIKVGNRMSLKGKGYGIQGYIFNIETE